MDNVAALIRSLDTLGLKKEIDMDLLLSINTVYNENDDYQSCLDYNDSHTARITKVKGTILSTYVADKTDRDIFKENIINGEAHFNLRYVLNINAEVYFSDGSSFHMETININKPADIMRIHYIKPNTYEHFIKLPDGTVEQMDKDNKPIMVRILELASEYFPNKNNLACT